MSKSAWAKQAGIGQTTFWNWTRDATAETNGKTAKTGVEFVRLDPGAIRSAMHVNTEAETAELQSEMTLENGELRVVARRGTRWSDMQRMVELLRGPR